jgi:hypothetical protein
MREHRYAVEVSGTPREVWEVFWYRGPRRPQPGGFGIEILHAGDEVGEGLIRHCTFRVPRYLLSGGVGHSWEWLTEVVPYRSWKYDAIGKPLWSRAEGRTRLEALGTTGTRIHFSETYHAFNPALRLVLERRVHDFISKDNDRIIAEAVEAGVVRMRRRHLHDDAGAPAHQGETDTGAQVDADTGTTTDAGSPSDIVSHADTGATTDTGSGSTTDAHGDRFSR